MDMWGAISAVAAMIAAFYAGMAYHRSQVDVNPFMDYTLQKRLDGMFLIKLRVHPGRHAAFYQRLRVRGGTISYANCTREHGVTIFTPVHGFSPLRNVFIDVPSTRISTEPVEQFFVISLRNSATISLCTRDRLRQRKIKLIVNAMSAVD